MSSVRAVAAGFLLLGAGLGCSGNPRPTVSGRTSQVTLDLGVSSMALILVFAVDDEPTDGAMAIRAQTVGSLRATLEERFTSSLSGLYTDWARADLRVVVVRPSLAGSARALGPADNGALALVSENATLADVDALADATAQVVGASVAPAGAPYSLIDATTQTIELITHARAPVDSREAALLASLGTPSAVGVVVATSHDDASSEPVDPGAWTRAPLFIDPITILAPLSQGSAPCGGSLDPSTRIARWLGARTTLVDFMDTRCQEAIERGGEEGLLGSLSVDRSFLCLPAAPAARPEGGAACRVHATLDSDAPCATQLGMLDPLDSDGVRRARTVRFDAGGPRRVCEIQELEGAEADACSQSLPCPGCSAGWCTASVRPCPFGTFRFVHGAAVADSATLEFVCDVEL